MVKDAEDGSLLSVLENSDQEFFASIAIAIGSAVAAAAAAKGIDAAIDAGK